MLMKIIKGYDIGSLTRWFRRKGVSKEMHTQKQIKK